MMFRMLLLAAGLFGGVVVGPVVLPQPAEASSFCTICGVSGCGPTALARTCNADGPWCRNSIGCKL